MKTKQLLFFKLIFFIIYFLPLDKAFGTYNYDNNSIHPSATSSVVRDIYSRNGTYTLEATDAFSLNSNGVGSYTNAQSGDVLHILKDSYYTITQDNHLFSKVIIEEGGTLRVGKTTGHNFTIIEGTGILFLSGDSDQIINLPQGDGKLTEEGFYQYNTLTGKGGTVVFEGDHDILVDATVNELSNVIVNIGETNTLFLQSITLNGNLMINKGIVSFGSFNDSDQWNLGAAQNLTIFQDFSVSSAAQFIQNPNDNSFNHSIESYGNVTVDGNVTLPNVNLKALNQEIDQNEKASQLFLFNEYTTFRYLNINKPITSTLKLEASSNGMLTLNTDGYALDLQSGTLEIGKGISYDLSGANYTIPTGSEVIVSNGGELIKSGVNAFYLEGKLSVQGGLVDIQTAVPSGITLREKGILEVNNGTLKAVAIRPTIASAISLHRGSFVQNGGTVILGKNAQGIQSFHTLNLPFADNSFEVHNGGILNVYAQSGWGIHIGSDPENVKVDGGEINIYVAETPNDFDPNVATPDYPTFIVNSSSPLYDVASYYQKSDSDSYTNYGRVKLDTASFFNGDKTIISSEANHLEIKGSLSLNTYFDGNNKDLFIYKDLNLNILDAIVYTGTLRSTNESKYFKSTVNWLNFVGNENSILNINYEVEEDIKADLTNISFGNFRINKDSRDVKVTLQADPSFSISVNTEANFANTPVDKEGHGFIPKDKNGNPVNGTDGSGYDKGERFEDYSNLVDFEGDFELLEGTFDHRNYSVRMFREGAQVKNYGVFGLYSGQSSLEDTEGTFGVQALLKFREGDITLETSQNSEFGNVRIFLEDHTLSLTSDVKINRIQYVSGTVDLSNHQLTIDRMRFDRSLNSYCKDLNDPDYDPACIAEKVPTFGISKLVKGSESWKTINYHNFFVTDGKPSSGGLKIKVDNFDRLHKMLTRIYTDEKSYHFTNNSDYIAQAITTSNSRELWRSLLFPVGIKDNGNLYYTPALLHLENGPVEITNTGYVSVRPALGILPTAGSDPSNELLNIYWNVEKHDFTNNTALPKVNWFFSISNDFASGNNPFTQSGNNLTKTDLEDRVPGKVLNGDDYIRQINNDVISAYQRKGFVAPTYNSDNHIVSGHIQQNVLLQSEYDNGSAFNPSSKDEDKVYAGKLVFEFEKDYDATSGRFYLENANYTVGPESAFNGYPGIYVYQNKLSESGGKYSYHYNDGEGSNTWDNILNWYVLEESSQTLSQAYTIPSLNDVAILGTEEKYTIVSGAMTETVPSTTKSFTTSYEGVDIELAQLIFNHSTLRRSALKIKGADLKIGKVVGSGEIELDFGADKVDTFYRPQLIGDFGDWAANEKSILKITLPKELKDDDDPSLGYNRADIGTQRLTEVELYDLPKLPYVEIHSGAGYFTEDLRAYQLDIYSNATVLVRADYENGDITADNNIRLNNNGALIFQKEGNFDRTVKTGGIISTLTTYNNGNNERNYNHIYVEQGEISTGTPRQHQLYVSGNIALADIVNFDLYGAGNDLWTPYIIGNNLQVDFEYDSENIPQVIADSANVSKVSLYFDGETDGKLTHADNEYRILPEFYDIVMNKSKSTKFTVERGFNLAKHSQGNKADKPLQLVSGELKFDLKLLTDQAVLGNPTDQNLNIDVNTGGEEFYIASDAKLTLGNASTISVSSTEEMGGGILLDGTLEVIEGGVARVYNGSQTSNNYISYGSSGSARINILEGAELIVGSQLRRQLSSERGTITLYQEGGKIEIGGQDISDELSGRAILEIVDEGAIQLNYDVTTLDGNLNYFKLKGSESYDSNQVSLLFTPNSPSLSYFFKDNTITTPSRFIIEGVSGKDFMINSSLPLGNTDIINGHVGVITNDLSFYGNLMIDENVIFNQHEMNISFYGNIYNSGTYNGNSKTANFIGGKPQYLGDYNAVNSGKKGSYNFGHVHLNGSNTELVVQYGKQQNNADGVTVVGNLVIEGEADIVLDIPLSLERNLLIHEGSSIEGTSAIAFEGTELQELYSDNGVIENLIINNEHDVHIQDPNNETLFLKLSINGDLTLAKGNLVIDENSLYLGEQANILGSGNGNNKSEFNASRMLVLSDRNRDGGVIKFIEAGDTNNFCLPVGVLGKYTPIAIDLSSNVIDETIGIEIKLLNEKPVKAYRSLVYNNSEWVNNPVSFENSDILNYAWYMDIVKMDGTKFNYDQLPTLDFDVTFYYDVNDVENDESKYLPAISIGSGFKNFTTDEVNTTDHSAKILINNAIIEYFDNINGVNEFSALIAVGDPDHIVSTVPIYRSKNVAVSPTEENWDDASIWEVNLIGGHNSDEEGNNAWLNTTSYPDGGPIVIIQRGTKVKLDFETVIAELIIEGNNDNYPAGEFIVESNTDKSDVNNSIVGNISGQGILVMRTDNILDDNWTEFLTINNGSLVLEKNDFQDNYFFHGGLFNESDITDMPNNKLIAISAINATTSGIYSLQTKAADVEAKQSYPVYHLKNNIMIGEGGVTVNEYSALVVGDDGVNITMETSTLNLKSNSTLALAGGSKIVVNGTFNVESGARIYSYSNSSGVERILEFKEDINIVSGVDLSEDVFTFALTGNGQQQMINANITGSNSLRKLVIDNNYNEKLNNQAAVHLLQEINVNDLELIDGILDVKNGLLNHIGDIAMEPDDVMNTMESYIVGLAKFRVPSDHKENTFFPVGTIQEFHPIGIGRHEVRPGAGDDNFSKNFPGSYITWEVGFTSGAADLLIPDNSINDVYEGYWELNPINLSASEKFTTTVNFIYTGKLDRKGASVEDLRILHQDIDNINDINSNWNFITGDLDTEPEDITTSGSNNIVQSQPITFNHSSNSSVRWSSSTRTMTEISTPSNEDNVITVASLGEDLPIELSHFTASVKEGKVYLAWQTLTEINNKGFAIYRTKDGKNYEKVGFVEGYGNSNVKLDYSFVDEAPYSGISYYRLIQSDFDGRSESFGPVEVTIGNNDPREITENAVVIYPNPSNGEDVNMELYQMEGIIEINLINNEGKILSTERINTDYSRKMLIKTSSLKSGIYFIKVVNGFDRIVKKLIVQ
ncbi:T9SS type A sorting domain-containing protein [Flammeovirga sp. SubArs3]|uniref:T9SS type A sorting domain-containing protein n=1 Tax=Flammeovirga sp. SubArs3 TaxID=2995316 RepID=UPI00248B876E|nr:T9SS type A sorting domain-containing protein [Flammeovirga sp. SubArs3]